ncbi:rhomboid-domain-containing protein [Lactarius hatsudake]|nr:rhomboid-domain-containing protein [Lactarius hatsudake]
MFTFLRSSHSIKINARYTLHSTSLLRSRVSPFQKFHATDLFSATHRDALRHAPRRHWRPVGPFQRFRRRFDNTPPVYIIFGILGINGAVFAAWSYVQMFQGTLYRPPSAKWLARWLQDNFINSYENLRDGRFWTLVTSTFSHAQFGHALFNGLTFWFLAPTALTVLGNTQFLALYLGSGAFASLVSLVWNKERNYHSHGASGAIYALASFFAFAAPRARFLLFFVLPMPAWACIGGIACFDVYNAFTRQFPSLDSAGHVGGLAGGALYWVLRTRLRLR